MPGNVNRVTANLMIAFAAASIVLLLVLTITYDVDLYAYSASDGFSSQNSVAIMRNRRCGISRGKVWVFSGVFPYTGSLRFLGDGDSITYLGDIGGGSAREVFEPIWRVGDCRCFRRNYIDDGGTFVGHETTAYFPGIWYYYSEGLGVSIPTLTLRVSLWYPILLFAGVPGLWTIWRIMRMSRVVCSCRTRRST